MSEWHSVDLYFLLSPYFYFPLLLSSYVYLFISYYFPSWSNYDDVLFYFILFYGGSVRSMLFGFVLLAFSMFGESGR